MELIKERAMDINNLTWKEIREYIENGTLTKAELSHLQETVRKAILTDRYNSLAGIGFRDGYGTN